jgi:hypothetical protein
MKTHFVAALVLALTSSVALAENATDKAMHDHPGTSAAGSTANPTAKPNSGSLAEKAMQDQPGVNSDKTGNTAAPTAKADDGSLSGKQMKDQLKN